MVRLQVLSGLLYGHGRGDQPYCIFYEDVVTLLSDNRIKDHTKEVLPGGERRSGFLCDMPGKRTPCLHERVFAPLRSVLDACHWHAAPFAGQRTANGLTVSCP